MKVEPENSWQSGHQGTGDSHGFPGCKLEREWARIYPKEPPAHPCPQLLGPTTGLGREGEVTGDKLLAFRK